jgi:phosphohistidine phosphatase
MRIYLVQHGRPVSKEENPDRPLSDQGRHDVTRMAQSLAKCGITAEVLYHSGKTRALQTAEIINSNLPVGRGILQRKGLAPMDDVHQIADLLNRSETDIMVVGHLPHLAKLTSLLVTGSDMGSVVLFQQGGVVCLEKNDNRGWVVAWVLIPELIHCIE